MEIRNIPFFTSALPESRVRFDLGTLLIDQTRQDKAEVGETVQITNDPRIQLLVVRKSDARALGAPGYRPGETHDMMRCDSRRCKGSHFCRAKVSSRSLSQP